MGRALLSKVIKVGVNFSREQLKKDTEITRKLIAKLDEEYAIKDNPVLSQPHSDVYEFALLDLQVLYLRMVHTYCYWSGAEFSNDRILISKCGSVTTPIVIA